MDPVKIGKFIALCRRQKGLTQLQLAEHLNITDRAVSKWETGRSMPDSALMLDLCRELGISVNDLLCGEVITMDHYKENSEKLLLELAKQKEEADKQFLSLEIVIGVLSMVILLGFTFAASFFQMADWMRIYLIVIGLIIAMIGLGSAIRIEQTAGYYACAKCHHRYVPTLKSVFWAMHVNRTRYMKCPHCHKWSWNKKVLTKE